MARINQNFSMYSGNSEFIYITVKDPKNIILKLTGMTFSWTMQLRGRTICTKNSIDGISITDSDNGRVCVKLKPIDTKGISGECDHELLMTDGDGNVTTVTTGKVTIIHSLLDIQ